MKDFRKSVIYQIYPKSFKDSNGDGFGDIQGVIEKLGYLKTLGVDCIWLTPFYVSPQKDNGYDISDYYSIDPRFGTMKDFEEMVEQAKRCEIDVMLDMVFNHTSTEHRWFKRATEGDEKYKNYYIFKEPRDGKEPTNWKSKFGGTAWEYVERFNEYYLHLYDVTQADLNWKNEEVKKEVFKIINYWIKKGVKGFRLDVINLISKPDQYEDDYKGDGRRFYTDGPCIHQYLKELNRETFGKHEDIVTVGEMSSTTIENCIKYSNPKEKELSMVFNFHHLKVDYPDGEKWINADFNFMDLKEIISRWQIEIHEGGGWNALFWCNHDQPRIVSRFGDDNKYRKESAKMLATTIHMMQGTPYIYQGEEIGMTNPDFDNICDYRDVEALNIFEISKQEGMDEDIILDIIKKKSRDNSRTPMQWNSNKYAGFTTGTPWINLASNFKEINVEEALKDKDSVFYHYRNLIKLRKEFDIITYGDYRLILKDHKDIFAYIREYEDEILLVINNFYGRETIFELPTQLNFDGYRSEILISNYKNSPSKFKNIKLRPYESIVYHLVK